jgi:hypothetical protein
MQMHLRIVLASGAILFALAAIPHPTRRPRGLYISHRTAHQMGARRARQYREAKGAPTWLIVRMVVNAFLDTTIGTTWPSPWKAAKWSIDCMRPPTESGATVLDVPGRISAVQSGARLLCGVLRRS